MPRNVESGMGFPAGATWDANRGGTNFALFARHATRVELCLFDAPDGTEGQHFDLPERVEHVWRGSYPMRGRVNCTGIGCMVHTSRSMATGSIPPSC